MTRRRSRVEQVDDGLICGSYLLVSHSHSICSTRSWMCLSFVLLKVILVTHDQCAPNGGGRRAQRVEVDVPLPLDACQKIQNGRPSANSVVFNFYRWGFACSVLIGWLSLANLHWDGCIIIILSKWPGGNNFNSSVQKQGRHSQARIMI